MRLRLRVACDQCGRGRGSYERTHRYLCGAARGEDAYLNQPEVRSALHVCSEEECGVFPGDHGWSAPYNRTMYTEADLYREFIAHGLRVMIYSGDTDACIPYSGTEEWVEELRLPSVESWRPWTIDNATQMAGYVTTYNYRTGTPGSFLFVTVRRRARTVTAPVCDEITTA
jgi:serine carboxypeptidase-like clade 1